MGISFYSNLKDKLHSKLNKHNLNALENKINIIQKYSKQDSHFHHIVDDQSCH